MSEDSKVEYVETLKELNEIFEESVIDDIKDWASEVKQRVADIQHLIQDEMYDDKLMNKARIAMTHASGSMGDVLRYAKDAAKHLAEAEKEYNKRYDVIGNADEDENDDD